MTKRSVLIAVILVITIISLLFFNKWKVKDPEGFLFVEGVTFKTSEGFGYDVLVDHKRFIHQQYIPAIQGKKVFLNKEDAKKVADLVIQKITHEQQPVVTVAEIDSLKIYY